VLSLLLLTLAIGLTPLMVGLVRLRYSAIGAHLAPSVASVLQCVLAFNLTFFWQELWLVLPKALTPGLHPILFHNNHTWSGDNRLVELLQGTGAVATLVSGLVFYGMLVAAGGASLTARLFLFWMAFQGIYQSLTQLAIGALIPGNDVGRALTFLGLTPLHKGLCLVIAVVLMALAGRSLAGRFPERRAQPVGRIGSMLFSGIVSLPLIAAFRVPRSAIEVVLVPLIINLIGTGWLILGETLVKARVQQPQNERALVLVPAVACCVTLLIFQLILRPGIRF